MKSGTLSLHIQFPLKLGLIGYGKMGKMVEELALKAGHEVTLNLEKSDVIIDFSHADAVMDNLQQACQLQKNIVIGTTGWHNLLPEVKKIAANHDRGVLYAPNFSIGMHLFLKSVKLTCELLKQTNDYDVAGFEVHHNQKKDAPSGTALALQKAILEVLPDTNLNFQSIRVGDLPGTHTVIFDSPNDTITLTHQAKDRKAFALGAIAAASWVYNKKGLFTLEDMFP